MNVENRKLFRNKDARSRLADMGGIIASSPELLGEVQKFKTGTRNGEVVEANSLMAQFRPAIIEQSIAGVYGPDVQTTFIGRAIAGEFGPEVRDNTMNKALAGEFGEDIKAKAETLSPIYNTEVPPIIEETPPVLSQPSVQPNTFSSESMINEQAPRPTVPKFPLGQDVPSGMPLVEGPGPAPAFPMNTAADSTDPLGVLTNPRTGEPMTLLPPQERSTQALEPRSGLRTLLDRLTIKAEPGDAMFGARRDPRVATESVGFLDSDAGQEISPEMAQELKILEQAREAQEFAGGFGQSAKKFGEAGLEAANIAGGVIGSGSSGLIARGLDAAGYVTGAFPNISKPLFRASDTFDDFKKTYYGDLVDQENYLPRMYTPPKAQFSAAELLAQDEAAEKEALAKQSLAAIENADASVFSEGAPTELTPAGRAQRAADSVTRMSEQGMPKGLSAEAINRIQEQQAQEAAEKEMDAAGRRLIAGQPREVGPVEIQPEVDSSLSFPRITSSINSALEAGGTFVEGILGKERTDVLRENIEKVNERIDSRGERKKVKEAAEFADELNPQGPNFVPAPKKVTTKKEVELKDDNSLVVDGEQIVDTGTTSGSKDKPTTTSSLYAGYKKEIQDLLGGGKKDKNKEKWEDFSLAMFRIAAGKDPDAVANIAAGLAEAAADKKTSRSIQQERDDKINLLAMKMTGDERIANIRASDAYGKRRDPLTQMYMLADTLYADGSGDYENYVDALAAAKTQVSKDYGSGFDGGQPSEEQLVKTITTKAEFDALPSGTEFIQNGQKRKKPQG